MIDFLEIPEDGEQWELFARDFLLESGFFIESAPDRGADGGKDMLVSEQLLGNLNKYKFTWLVSCKHFAKSKRSVNEGDEPNIRERLDSFGADGFIGFYSTVPSAAWNTRLNQLKAGGKIKDFKFFDYKLIENHLIRLGFSKILMRYFPKSYTIIKPLHLLFDEYLPLKCDYCGKDLLEALMYENYPAIIASCTKNENEKIIVKDIYWACKGGCDRYLNRRAWNVLGCITAWEEISTLLIPVLFLRWILTTMNQMRSGNYIYEDEAYKKEKYFIMAFSQKVMREMTEKEREDAIEQIKLHQMFE